MNKELKERREDGEHNIDFWRHRSGKMRVGRKVKEEQGLKSPEIR